MRLFSWDFNYEYKHRINDSRKQIHVSWHRVLTMNNFQKLNLARLFCSGESNVSAFLSFALELFTSALSLPALNLVLCLTSLHPGLYISFPSYILTVPSLFSSNAIHFPPYIHYISTPSYIYLPLTLSSFVLFYNMCLLFSWNVIVIWKYVSIYTVLHCLSSTVFHFYDNYIFHIIRFW